MSISLPQLEKDIYIYPLPGHRDDYMCWKLKKCQYSVKQSIREWYKTLYRSRFTQRFVICSFDTCVFKQTEENIYISVYIDNIALFGSPSHCVKKLHNQWKRTSKLWIWILQYDCNVSIYTTSKTLTYALREATSKWSWRNSRWFCYTMSWPPQ